MKRLLNSIQKYEFIFPDLSLCNIKISVDSNQIVYFLELFHIEIIKNGKKRNSYGDYESRNKNSKSDKKDVYVTIWV